MRLQQWLLASIIATAWLAASIDSRAADGAEAIEVRVLPGPGQKHAVPCAIYAPARREGQKPGLVVHLYGAGGSLKEYNLSRPPYARLRRLLRERGYYLVVPDLGPAHWMNEPAVASVDAVVGGIVKDAGIDSARVHIVGTSMGGASALSYAMRRTGAVRSVCAVFPVTDFEQPGWRERIGKAYGGKGDEALAALRKASPARHPDAFAKLPVLLIHGDADTTVPVAQSRAFVAALRGKNFPITYRETKGLHQDAIVEPFQNEIADFLQSAEK